MQITIENDKLSLTVDTHGAQMKSIRSKADGTEYLWQGDPGIWADRAPVLFPVIGRLWGREHLVQGEKYPMGLHGFACNAEFIPLVKEGNRLSLALCPSREIEKQFPYELCLQISYLLHDDEVFVTTKVGNMGEKTMPFAIGGHPGFRVPLCEGESFEDYTLEFTHPCHPERIGFSEEVLMNGSDSLFPLEEDRRLDLRHSLFDDDAIILRNADREVTLRSRKSGRGVTVSYPQMAYVGFWHMPKTEAPYVCIEPWTGLPGRQNITEDLTCRSDYLQLPPDGICENRWIIRTF